MSYHRQAFSLRPLGLMASLFVAACNPPQPLNFSVQNVQVSPVVADADLKGITVTPAAPDERVGALPPRRS
jgi:hypothetical protein